MVDGEREEAERNRVRFNRSCGLMDITEHKALARWAKEAAIYLKKAATGQFKGIDSAFVDRLLHELDNKLETSNKQQNIIHVSDKVMEKIKHMAEQHSESVDEAACGIIEAWWDNHS